MGMIKVELLGSFSRASGSFSAMKHGHAAAVAEAIQWLSAEVLPKAIAQDHQLHTDGAAPTHGFGQESK